MDDDLPKPASEWVLRNSGASYPSTFVDAMFGTPDEWAELGQVNLHFLPANGEYFMRLNTTAWGGRQIDRRFVADMRRIQPNLDAVWHGPCKRWLICGVGRRGATRDTDLLCVVMIVQKDAHFHQPGHDTLDTLRRMFYQGELAVRGRRAEPAAAAG